MALILLCTIIINGYVFAQCKEANNSKTMIINWQRLVDEKGKTCERCGATRTEVQKAYQNLKQSLKLIGINVVLEEKDLDVKTCAKDISQSNRIWIGERALEEWLGAKVGKSLCDLCCDELGDEIECRTIIFEGNTYEVIPENLIIKAGLIAASHLVTIKPDAPCCEEKIQDKKDCCPKNNNLKDSKTVEGMKR